MQRVHVDIHPEGRATISNFETYSVVKIGEPESSVNIFVQSEDHAQRIADAFNWRPDDLGGEDNSGEAP